MNENENSRVDMHVHSTASELSKLGVQRSLHLPECATEPWGVYELAKAQGMDFVTITDHDTIDGALAISHLPDTFVSKELTVSFKQEPQAVHVLCYGITSCDHEWLQAHNDDVESRAAYLPEHEIAAATWPASLVQLAGGYLNALHPTRGRGRARVA
jgi:predicted metal-dependent phosphoesterase TrpH